MADDVDLAVRVAAAHVLVEWAKGEYEALRAEQQKVLNDLEANTNVKSVTVTVPGIGDVATMTIPADKGGFLVVDDDEFAEAVEQFYPDAIETIIRVKPDVAKAILRNVKMVAGTPTHVSKDGEMHPLGGVMHRPPRGKGEATKFTMTFTKPADPDDPTPKERLLDIVLSGGMPSLLGPHRPELEQGDGAVVDAELVDDGDAA